MKKFQEALTTVGLEADLNLHPFITANAGKEGFSRKDLPYFYALFVSPCVWRTFCTIRENNLLPEAALAIVPTDFFPAFDDHLQDVNHLLNSVRQLLMERRGPVCEAAITRVVPRMQKAVLTNWEQLSLKRFPYHGICACAVYVLTGQLDDDLIYQQMRVSKSNNYVSIRRVMLGSVQQQVPPNNMRRVLQACCAIICSLKRQCSKDIAVLLARWVYSSRNMPWVWLE